MVSSSNFVSLSTGKFFMKGRMAMAEPVHEIYVVMFAWQGIKDTK